MKRLRIFIVTVAAVALFGIPQLASCQSGTLQVIYGVCWKYVTEKNCNKCSDYFSVQNEEEAIRKCKRRGYGEPNYFQSVGQIRRWILSNCTCGDDDSD